MGALDDLIATATVGSGTTLRIFGTSDVYLEYGGRMKTGGHWGKLLGDNGTWAVLPDRRLMICQRDQEPMLMEPGDYN